MAFDLSNYLVIGSDPSGSGHYYVHERKTTSDGKPGEIVTLADGNGDVRQVVQRYVEAGFNPEKIIINGQLATDVFQKSGDNKSQKVKNAQNFASAMMLMCNPLAYIAMRQDNIINAPNFNQTV